MYLSLCKSQLAVEINLKICSFTTQKKKTKTRANFKMSITVITISRKTEKPSFIDIANIYLVFNLCNTIE